MFWRKKKPNPRRKPALTKGRRHYLAHKELTRKIVLEKIEYWNQFYNYQYGQVRIKMVKTRWGSCSSKGNLNFNYKIIFLPEHLQDYIIVHELCHLEQLNHSAAFWSLVERTLPNYKNCVRELRKMHIAVK